MKVLDVVRSKVHAGITGPIGDNVTPVRLSKEMMRRVNVVLGQPLCTIEELEKRRAAEAKLAQLRGARSSGSAPSTPIAASPRVQAPVNVYFEKDRNARELERIEQLLAAKNIVANRLDLAGDENTLQFVMRTANVKADELPVVFVGDMPIGGYTALVDADVSGRLQNALYPKAN